MVKMMKKMMKRAAVPGQMMQKTIRKKKDEHIRSALGIDRKQPRVVFLKGATKPPNYPVTRVPPSEVAAKVAQFNKTMKMPYVPPQREFHGRELHIGYEPWLTPGNPQYGKGPPGYTVPKRTLLKSASF